MTEPFQPNLTSQELDQLQQLRASVSEFKRMVDMLPSDVRSAEYNAQFNQLRLEARALLKGGFTRDVPKAITGDTTRDRSLTIIVILGVILALTGLGVNSIILDDVLVNSLGCCISSGGMLLVVGTFVALVVRNIRERTTDMDDLRQRCDLLLYQIDHRLNMINAGSGEFVGGGESTPDVSQYPEQT